MMNDVQAEYWERFNRLGKQQLSSHNFLFELMPFKPGFPELFQIILTKDFDNYILSFSTHHLDYQDGVTVTQNGELLLPAPKQRSTGESGYGYTDKYIRQLIDDLCGLP